MQDLKLKLREAGLHDLALISALASQIWEEHYIPIIGEKQVSYMLNLLYNPASLTEQMNVKKHRFYLVDADEETIGFVSVHHEKDEDWFLNKFYILTQKAAKGLGTKALEALKKIIRPKKITLTVNRQNYKSVNFYFKNNFKIDRVADFDIGDGYVMNDFVMVWNSDK